jgi:hypothetical protein
LHVDDNLIISSGLIYLATSNTISVGKSLNEIWRLVLAIEDDADLLIGCFGLQFYFLICFQNFKKIFSNLNSFSKLGLQILPQVMILADAGAFTRVRIKGFKTVFRTENFREKDYVG